MYRREIVMTARNSIGRNNSTNLSSPQIRGKVLIRTNTDSNFNITVVKVNLKYLSIAINLPLMFECVSLITRFLL